MPLKTVYVLPKELALARKLAVGLKSEGKPEWIGGIEQIPLTFRYQRDAESFANALPQAVHQQMMDWIWKGKR